MLAVLDSVINSVTGMETVSARLNPVIIYPNPAKDEVKVSGLVFNTGDEYEFQMFDALGRNLLKAKLNSSNANVSVERLDNGVYQYVISSSSGVQEKVSGKIVIQK